MRVLSWLATCLLVAGLGCSGTETKDAAKQPAKNGKSTAPAKQAAKVEIAVKSWDETETFIASKKGKVVVMDLWSTW